MLTPRASPNRTRPGSRFPGPGVRLHHRSPSRNRNRPRNRTAGRHHRTELHGHQCRSVARPKTNPSKPERGRSPPRQGHGAKANAAHDVLDASPPRKAPTLRNLSQVKPLRRSRLSLTQGQFPVTALIVQVEATVCFDYFPRTLFRHNIRIVVDPSEAWRLFLIDDGRRYTDHFTLGIGNKYASGFLLRAKRHSLADRSRRHHFCRGEACRLGWHWDLFFHC